MKREEINKKLGLTEEQLDARAEEYETDKWDSSALGKVIMGRPSIADEEVRPITFRLPISKIDALDRKASEHGSTRSKVLREALDEYLMQA
jgi:predicted DNA binding CopG/RHH family protein